jgi:4-hydroxy-tetrahydrodipicolinate synthase
MGAHGCTAATANSFPEFTVEVWQATVRGDFELAAKLQKRLTALTELQNQGLPMATVYAMTSLRGIDIGLPRAPIQVLSDKSRLLLENNLCHLQFLEKSEN